MATLINIQPGTSAPPLSSLGRERVEKSLELPFSQTYVDFLIDTNGGVPVRKYFFLNKNEKVVERMLSVVDRHRESPIGAYDVEVVWSQIEGRLDDSLMPFAALFGGDFLCFLYEGHAEPKVVLWDHERSREDAPVLTPVASTFLAFAEMLHE
jgi:hypothetical protein